MKQRLFIAGLILTPLLWLFGRALATDEMFVFRDAAHYYYPYYKYVAQQWGEGRVPLWNPLENLGQPLLADATAAVLYPGKLIFALPLGYDLNYKLYIVGHVLLAAISAFIAARGFARSNYAATVCAISYAFSGSVVFQYCNVIFLVGAAWLPLAVLAIDRILRRRSWRWAAALAAILAMMVFGGDPQLAYHVGLIAVLYALILWRAERVGRISYPPTNPPTTRSERNSDLRIFAIRLGLLFAAGGFAFLLAAAQILPSMQWTPKTSRAATDVPRNVYELARGVGNEIDLPASQRCEFLLGKQENDHHIDSYVFSVGPWHLAGCIWPNVFGNLFPENTRWIRALPAEGRMWTPTLYMGLLPLLLALSQFRFRLQSAGRARLPPSQNDPRQTTSARQEPRPPNDPESTEETSRRAWLTWTVVLALFASFGWYGLGWIIIEIYHLIFGQDAAELLIGSPLGGIYWLLQSFAPGYVLFRYPAKWLVVFACGMSLLSAYGWDGMVNESTRFVRRGLLVIVVATAILIVIAHASLFYHDVMLRLSDQIPRDVDFGPFKGWQARWTVWIALMHTFIVGLLIFCLLPRSAVALVSVRKTSLLVLIAADLCIAQQALFMTGPALPSAAFGSPTARLSRVERELFYRGDGMEVPTLPPHPNGVPRRYFRNFSPHRSDPRWVAREDWDSLFPKYNLLQGFDALESPSAMMSQEYREFLQSARRRGSRRANLSYPNLSILRAISTDLIVFSKSNDWIQYPENVRSIGGGPNSSMDLDYPGLFAIGSHKRARIAHEFEAVAPLEVSSPSAMKRHTDKLLFPVGRQDTAVFAVVESNELSPRKVELEDAYPGECEISRYDADHVSIHAKLNHDGLVILADAYAEGWICEVTNRTTGETTSEPILRTNRVLRGVWLPAGEYDVVFRYRPTSFYVGAALSGVGWALLIAVAAMQFRIRKRRNRDTSPV